LKKYREQYGEIEIQVFKKSHDRFVIIDDKEIYHIGASLKDLGKRWFAFSKMNLQPQEILNKLTPS
ncbi:MAG: ORF6N domain-containing protein, partial [Bacteroidetes bacterium]|nr:ORF6N domain-containing protein [Bacteroidota bacterium]